MAGMDDIRAQLAALLGKPRGSIGKVRKTDETPPRVAVIDVVMIITGKDARHAAQEVRTICDRNPAEDQNVVLCQPCI